MEILTKNNQTDIKSLAERYSFATCGSIGKGLLGREISYLRVGKADCNLLYVAGDAACEALSEKVLLHFARQLCEYIEKDRCIHGICPAYLVENRSIYILPRLNPDGRQIAAGGADPACPLYERQLRQNNMQSDFSNWRGNARGVHPGQNFNFEFAKRKRAFWQSHTEGQCEMGEFPESEPESASLASLARILKPNCLVQIQKGPACFSCFPETLVQKSALCRMTGLSENPSAGNSLGGWFHCELARPSLLFQVDDARAEIAYEKLQEALFGACFLFGCRQK